MSVLAQGCGFGDVGCAAAEAANSVFEGIVRSVATGAAELVVSFAAWWVETDSVNPLDNAVVSAQAATRPVILVVLVGAVLVQSIRIMLSRKGEPLLMVLTGLIRYAVVSALGLTTLHIALQAGDALAADLLDGAVGNFAQLMQDLLTNGEGDAIFLVLLVSLIAAVLSLVQWVLMAMRQAGLLVLAAMLPLAASGSLTRSTRGWLDKLMVWLIAMVVCFFRCGFSLIELSSEPSNSVADEGGRDCSRDPSSDQDVSATGPARPRPAPVEVHEGPLKPAVAAVVPRPERRAAVQRNPVVDDGQVPG